MNEFAAFLGTYLLHSTALIGAALITHRMLRNGNTEPLLRTALLAGFLTAGLQHAWPMLSAQTERASPTPVPAAAAPITMPFPLTMRVTDTPSNSTPVRLPAEQPAVSTDSLVAASWFGEALVAGWLALIALLGTRLYASWWSLRLRLRDRKDCEDPRVLAILESIGSQRSIRLTVSDSMPSPVAIAGGEVCLPPRFLDLPEPTLMTVLAHEVAHAERHDPEWLWFYRVVEIVGCLQPLNFVAVRVLNRQAEYHADARAAGKTGSARLVAQSLSDVAHWLRAEPHGALASAAGSELVSRVQRLLEGQVGLRKLSSVIWCLAIACVVATAGALPRVAVSDERSDVSVSVQDNDSDVNAVLTIDGRKIDYRSSGRVRYHEDRGLLPQNDDSMIEIHDRSAVRRSVAVRRQNGELLFDYEEDRKLAELDRRWYREVSRLLVRRGGLVAEQRVTQLLEDGTDALLQEIAQLESTYLRGRYLQIWLAQDELDREQILQVTALASELEGDFERRQVFDAIIRTQDVDEAGATAIIRKAATSIESDFELASVLIHAVRAFADSDRVAREIEEAAAAVDSSVERERIVRALAGQSELAPHPNVVPKVHVLGQGNHVIATAPGAKQDQATVHKFVYRATPPQAPKQPEAPDAPKTYEALKVLESLKGLKGLKELERLEALRALEGLADHVIVVDDEVIDQGEISERVEAEMARARKQLETAKRELRRTEADRQQELEMELAKAREELAQAREEMREEIVQAQAEVEQARAELEEQQRALREEQRRLRQRELDG